MSVGGKGGGVDERWDGRRETRWGPPVWPQSATVPEGAPPWTLEVNGSQLHEALATAHRSLQPDLRQFPPDTLTPPAMAGSC